MSESERFKRIPLPRTAPLRNMATMFRSANPPPTSDANPGESTPRNTVERGVEMGYNVVEEQLRQGRRAARERSMRQAGPMGDNMQLFVSRMVRYWADAFAMWLELMDPNTLGPDGMRDMWRRWQTMMDPSGWNTPGQPRSTRPEDTDEKLRVSCTVASGRPVRVAFDLRPGCRHRHLIASGLRAVERDKPTLDDVLFHIDRGEPDELCIEVAVPDEQPAGLYTGWIIDQDNGETQGMLSVHIAE